jgi:hypothetical protein
MPKPSDESCRWTADEPSLDELLSDPACQLLMSSDRTSVETVSALIRTVRSAYDRRSAAPCGLA